VITPLSLANRNVGDDDQEKKKARKKEKKRGSSQIGGKKNPKKGKRDPCREVKGGKDRARDITENQEQKRRTEFNVNHNEDDEKSIKITEKGGEERDERREVQGVRKGPEDVSTEIAPPQKRRSRVKKKEPP